jgi:hypothetical protein
MRRAFSWVAAAAVVLAGGLAAAKTDDKPAATTPGAHPRYAKSLADAMAEAKERGCVVFATVHEDG